MSQQIGFKAKILSNYQVFMRDKALVTRNRLCVGHQ